MLGGSTHFDKNKEKWDDIITININGSLTNMYCRNDRVLGLLSNKEKNKFRFVGRHPIKLKEEEGEDLAAIESVINHNLSKCMG